jgi:hypothetical protein
LSSPSQSNPPTDSGWLPAILAGFALLFSFGALMTRFDDTGEFQFQIVIDWLILGPLWGSVVFLCVRFETRGSSKGQVVSRSVGIITWIVISVVAHWWANKQYVDRHDLALEAVKMIESRASELPASK